MGLCDVVDKFFFLEENNTHGSKYNIGERTTSTYSTVAHTYCSRNKY
jgi:hypothetical protein